MDCHFNPTPAPLPERRPTARSATRATHVFRRWKLAFAATGFRRIQELSHPQRCEELSYTSSKNSSECAWSAHAVTHHGKGLVIERCCFQNIGQRHFELHEQAHHANSYRLNTFLQQMPRVPGPCQCRLLVLAHRLGRRRDKWRVDRFLRTECHYA